MTEDRLPLAELLQKAGDGDFLRAVAEAVLQLLMESDVEGLIWAGCGWWRLPGGRDGGPSRRSTPARRAPSSARRAGRSGRRPSSDRLPPAVGRGSRQGS